MAESRENVFEKSFPIAQATRRYVFSARLGLVAQIFNLLYRRFVIGMASARSSALTFANSLQHAILRYGRLKICATLARYARRTEWKETFRRNGDSSFSRRSALPFGGSPKASSFSPLLSRRDVR